MAINIGIIGAGDITCRQHLPSLRRQPDVKVLAICDVRADTAESAARQFGIPHVYTDYLKMLEVEEIDAVHICTPNYMHVPTAVAALQAGKHVLIEKPLARTAREGQEAVAAANASGRKLMVAHVVRFQPEIRCLKQLIEAGELGDIYYARAWALRRRGVPTWGIFTDKEKQGGGPLVDIGVHMLDLALYLMGHPKPVSASGQCFTRIANTSGHANRWGAWDPERYSVEDFAAGFVRFENGAALSIESSFAANIAEDRMNCTILGSNGGAETDPLRIFSEQQGLLFDSAPAGIPDCNPYDAEIRAFYDAIRNDTEPPVTGEQALSVMQVLDALYESSDTGLETRIDKPVGVNQLSAPARPCVDCSP